MTRYKKFEENEAVMDVLFNLILGKRRVKELVKALKQSQPTISVKLDFLVRSGVVKKDKWVFEVNWKKLHKIFCKVARSWIELWVKDKRKVDGFMKIFDERRVRRIFEKFAEYYDIVKGKSVVWMVDSYLLGMTQVDDSELIKIDRRMVELKKYIKERSVEKAIFEEVEGIEEVE